MHSRDKQEFEIQNFQCSGSCGSDITVLVESQEVLNPPRLSLSGFQEYGLSIYHPSLFI